MDKIVKNPGNGRLNNLNDPVLNLLIDLGNPLCFFCLTFVVKLLKTSHLTVRRLWAYEVAERSVNRVTRLQILYNIAWYRELTKISYV
jgi:hypothetical protein